jgi:hypothetical protein
MMRFSKDGVLLADVPGSGVSKIDSNARSGNPRHDSRSGKFGSGGGGGKSKDPMANVPDNVDAMDFKRMLDAAREAAREFDTPSEGDIREFLAGRAKNPEAVDIQGFLKQVMEERKNDLVDLLDQQMRSSGPLQRGRRRVGVKAPRGYLKRLVGAMENNDLAEVMHRLEAMGHQRADVDKFFDGRVKQDRKAIAVTKRDAIVASDTWEGEMFEGTNYEAIDIDPTSDAVEMAEAILRNMPQPIINLQPVINVEMPKRDLDIKRDERGLMTRIEQN